MDSTGELIGYLGGGAGATAALGMLAKYVWDSVRTRKEQLEQRAEAERDEKMDAVLAKLSALEMDMVRLLEKDATQLSQVTELKSRVEGLSANYGGRLGSVEQSIAELRSRVVALESPRRRRGE